MANPATIALKHGGIWKAPFQIWVKDHSAWKDPLGGWIRHGGVWQQFWPLVDPTLNLDIDFRQMSALDSRFTYSRDGWGTYFDSNGILQYAANNTFINSENFTGIIANATCTLNAGIAPDGANTANFISATVSSSQVGWRWDAPADTPSGLIVSIYVKPGTKSWVCFACYPSFLSNFVWFDVANNLVTNQGSQWVAAGVQDVGDGWKRCWAKCTTGNGAMWLYVCDAGGSTDLTAPGNIYLWGGQYEYVNTQALPGTYHKTAASTIYCAPRFDHDPATHEPTGLMVEREVWYYSQFTQHFDQNPYWNPVNCTVGGISAGNGDGNVLAPDGLLTGFTLTATGVTPGEIWQYPVISMYTGQPFVYSVFVKKGTANKFVMCARNTNDAPPPATPAGYIWFDLTDGTVGSISPSVNDAGIIDIGNGWYRVWATRIGMSTGSWNFAFGPCDADGDRAVTADKTVYAWGSQIETHNTLTCTYPSSYAPVWIQGHRKAAEVVKIEGLNFSNWYNQSEGTFIVEFDTSAINTVNRYVMQASNGTANEQINLLMLGLLARGQVYDNGALQADLTAGNFMGPKVVHILGISYKANAISVCLNGGDVATDTGSSMPTPNRLNIGWEYALNVTNCFKGHIRRIRYYYVAKSPGELQLLTTMPPLKLSMVAIDGADRYSGSDMWTMFAATDGADTFAGVGANPPQQQIVSAALPIWGGSALIAEDHTGKTRII